MRLGELPDNEALIVCDAIFKRERPLYFVANDPDGPQAICDLNHREGGDGCPPHLVCLSWLFNGYSEASDLRDLEVGSCAWSDKDTWLVKESAPVDE